MDLTWKDYHKNGLLVEDLGFREAVKAFREQMLSVFDVAATHYGVGPIRCDEDLIGLYRSDYRFIWEQAHKMLQVLPVQNRFASDSNLLELLQKIGVKFPAFTAPHEMRCDMPNDTEFGRCSIHQDGVYARGSLNSVTAWIPLQDVVPENGCLRVVPKTHTYGLFPNRGGVITDFPEEDFIHLPMKAGDVLLFSHFTVHRSGKNIDENCVRMSIQIRYTDLMDKNFIHRGYPFPHEHLFKGYIRKDDYPEYYCDYERYYIDRNSASSSLEGS